MDDQLKDRIEARRHELLSKYNDLKADTRRDASSARDAMKKKLDELEDYLKEGWDKISDATRNKLDKWLEK
ncbi:MAG: hypothetical protein KF773_33875 [Deltaproteobacteria bacterium]|nr:hypothetical protein [Deltaproteobacteria bacterium]MCW5806274.1 hypothetical protein [Deltaproteobacteria bacterium]